MSTSPKHTLAEIKAQYPYMFLGEHELSFAHGWIDLFADLCGEVHTLLGEDKRKFRWIQIKEKFGSARFYWKLGKYEQPMAVDIFSAKEIVSLKVPSVRRRKYAGDDEMLMKKIGELVRAAEQKTRHLCIACGAPGKTDSNGWYMFVLCPEHARQRRAGTLAGFWFDQDE